ncbi:hypothetical protein NH8B_0994 [Pseudogulbenkiania sp. NH8B]|uniref:DUF4376 domain-containing protein n=1 Tax=Pseudogulbenkiania sp. (strain NH8B) TaxID=748280 RepID=UPI0002279AFD|nr:hypothetical protein [Pseudogulbenkiania sp. NH8B]BAK75826.1 hypothetical protein NH8B_0994 [Pseudogulbenkiania sp. NH8B]
MGYYIDKQGRLYAGDMQPGDREATAGEVAQKQLGTAITAKMAELAAACRDAIYAGFTSSALGEVRSYPFQDKDQANLNSSVTASMLPGNAGDWTTPFWCADAAGKWTWAPHTAEQIQQVGRDAMAAKLAQLQKNEALQKRVESAATIEDVQSIQWTVA